MVIPWNINRFTTEEPGWIEYSFRFFKVVDRGTYKELVYNLNTSPAKSEILIGLDAKIPLDSQLKPCICTKNNIVIDYTLVDGIYVCTIHCEDEECDHTVSATGYSKEEALIKASELWNTRKNDDENNQEEEENIEEGTGFHAQVYEILT